MGERETFRASELGEAAFRAFFRSMDHVGDKRHMPPPDWVAISSNKRKAWVRAALAVASLVAPMHNDGAPAAAGKDGGR